MRLRRPSKRVRGSLGSAKPSSGRDSMLLRDRAHHIRRDNDHQLGLVIDVVAAPEQGAEDRQLHQPGNAVDLLLGLFLNHAGQRQRTARRNFDGGFGAAGADRRNRQVWRGIRHAQGHGVVRRQVRDLGHDLEADAAFRQHHRREDQADAEFLEIDLWLADRRRFGGVARQPVGNREFAAGDEARGLAGDRGQVRLGQRAHDAGAVHGPAASR